MAERPLPTGRCALCADVVRADDSNMAKASNRSTASNVGRSSDKLHRALGLLDGIDDAILLSPPDHSRFTYSNGGAELLTGYSRRELARLRLGDLALDPDEPVLTEAFTALALGLETSVRRTFPIRRKDGQVAFADVTFELRAGLDDDSTVLALIARDVTSLLAHQRALREADERAVVAADRDRVARDLHDTVIQEVFGTALTLQSLKSHVEPAVGERLEQLIARQDQIVRELRSAVYGLTHHAERPRVSRRLTEVVDEGANALGFRPTLYVDGPIDDLSHVIVTEHLLPTLREALANIAIHAEATQVEVRVSAKPGQLRVRVSDDGIGLRVATGGRGLGDLAYRAAQLGGSMRVVAGGPSTTLEWTVPLP